MFFGCWQLTLLLSLFPIYYFTHPLPSSTLPSSTLQDVSDQIDNEDQLLGLKGEEKDEGEQQAEPQKKQLGEEERDTGVEISQNFEG